MELREIILLGKVLYPLFQIIRFVLIDINHTSILELFNEFSSGNIMIPLIANLPGLFNYKLLISELDNFWYVGKER